jgi:hypothetical protein
MEGKGEGNKLLLVLNFLLNCSIHYSFTIKE